jgi:hypothetical protein
MEYGFTGVVVRLLLRYEHPTTGAPGSLIAKASSAGLQKTLESAAGAGAATAATGG